MKTCTIDGCGRGHYARDLCRMHYARERRTGDPLLARKRGAKPKPPRPCSVEGCDKPCRTWGMCVMHFTREYRRKRRA